MGQETGQPEQKTKNPLDQQQQAAPPPDVYRSTEQEQEERPDRNSLKLSPDEITSMVRRLSHPTTASAQKASLWSRDRTAYDRNATSNMKFRSPEAYRERYDQLSPPGVEPWKKSKGEVKAIMKRLRKDTQASSMINISVADSWGNNSWGTPK